MLRRLGIFRKTEPYRLKKVRLKGTAEQFVRQKGCGDVAGLRRFLAIAVPEVKGQTGDPAGRSCLPPFVERLRPDAPLVPIKQPREMGSGIWAKPAQIKEGTGIHRIVV